jgi:hypothetical protein
MGVMGLVFALFTVGYILGVWTAFGIVRQPQGQYEDAVLVRESTAPVIVLGGASRVPSRRR